MRRSLTRGSRTRPAASPGPPAAPAAPRPRRAFMLFVAFTPRMPLTALVALLVAGSLWLPAGAAPPVASARGEADAPLVFERDVRPLLKAHCWHCHGEEAEPEGGFDARLARLVIAGGDSGPAVVPGDAEGSLLHRRIAAGEMPPGPVKVSADELRTIARWIAEGARTARPEPEFLAPGDISTAEDRAHWAFQPVVRPAVPDVPTEAEVRTPIDAFLWTTLRERGLDGFAPEADRATLVRRLSFDLTGLPPTPDEIAAFVADDSSDAHERLVERLLASPAYGERWGRHWLDVAGYADSDGYAAKDTERPWSWKYRDWVIDAFRRDMPFDAFLVEQLAGDELVPRPWENLTAEQAARLVATGFLRMAPDGTTDPASDQSLARNDKLAETIKIVSTALVGLSVGCAQCHAHRYDPISHADYHRLRAIFEPAYDWKAWRAAPERLVSQWAAETRAEAAKIDAELAEVTAARTAALDRIVAETFERELARLPADVQPTARAVRETPEKDRTAEQRALVKQYPFLNVNRGTVYLYLSDRLTGFTKEWDTKEQEVKARRPAEDWIDCLSEVPGHVPETKLFARGDHNQPRETVPPGELAILDRGDAAIPHDDPAVETTGRRLAYARHLTSGRHPLVARVLVNRFWMLHFGRGLVATPADFGVQGERPSHPELLDWLADEFVKSGWSLGHVHRLILRSRAYRQTSIRTGALDAIDPDNRLLGRMSVRRLEAEVVRDALLAASGELVAKRGGPPVPVAFDEVGQIVVGADNRDSAGRPKGALGSLGEEEFRRSVYVQVRRSMPLGILETFDMPDLAPNCEQRKSSTVAPQSLLMLNGPFVVARSRAMAERVVRETGDDPARQVARAWLLATGRPATTEETLSALAMLDAQALTLLAAPAPPPVDAALAPSADPAAVAAARSAALATLCQALVSSNRFLYVD
jgi:mono/diheme cytochrome c family protein